MSGDQVLDDLMEVFPLVNVSTLKDVSIRFKDDIDAAADYVIENVLPFIVPDASSPSTIEDLYIHGHQQSFNDTGTHLVLDPSKIILENEDSLVANQLKRLQTGLCSEVFAVPSTSGQACVSEECNSDPLQASSQNSHEVDGQLQHSPSERNPKISASEGGLSVHDDGSPDETIMSSYFVNLKSLDDAISDEHYKKITLLSNATAISEMLQEVELNEEKTKRAISEASQAGNDILVKVEELKGMTTLAVEDNMKVAGEVYAEKSILSTEAQELQTRLLNISEETKNFMSTIDEMCITLHRRLAAAEVERAAAEKVKLDREAASQKALKEQELSLEAAKEESKRLEQQAQENAKLRGLLMDRGHVVDALHGEMLGIFDSITQLKLRVDMQLPVDEQWQQVSSMLSSSAVDEPAQVPSILSSLAVDEPLQDSSILSRSLVDEPLQQISPILSSSAFGEPLQLVSSSLSSSVRSASSKSTLVESLASKNSWSSVAESNASLKNDERISDVSVGNFAYLDDSWDVVDDEETILSPTCVRDTTPMLL